MAEDPIERFNRLLGNRRGTPMRRFNPATQTPRYNPSGRAARVRRIARGSQIVPSATTRAYNKAIGGGVGGATSLTPRSATNIWQKTYDDLNAEFMQTATEMQAVESANQAQNPPEDEDRPWYGDLAEFGGDVISGIPGVSNILGTNTTGGFQNSPAGRAMDILSRPMYGVSEGLQSLAEVEHPLGVWETFREFGSGVGRGLTGEDKTGFGQVYETVKDNPSTGTGAVLREFEERHPTLEQRIAQGIGFAGEVGLDPLNALIPAAPNIIRGTGEIADSAALQRYFLNTAEDATNDFLTNSGRVAAIYRQNPSLLTDRIRNAVLDTYNRSVVDVQQGGSSATRLMNDSSWPAIVAERTREEIQQAMIQPFQQKVDDLLTNGRADGVYESTVLANMQYSDDYDFFWRELEKKLETSNLVPANPSIDDVLKVIESGRGKNIINDTLTDVMVRYQPSLEQVHDSVFTRAMNPTYRTVGVKLGNKTIPMRSVGRAYDYASSRVLNKTFPNRATWQTDTFFESAFPGVFGMKTARARALGFNVMEDFKDELQKMGRRFTQDQAKELQDLRARGVRQTGDPLMDEGLKFLDEHYEAMFREEQTLGARAVNVPHRSKVAGSTKGDNFTYIFNRGGTKEARTAFKKGRKAAWNDPAKIGSGDWTMAKAKADGLKPVENAFENLFFRYIKSRRDITRSLFRTDLVENYSIFGGKPIAKIPKKVLEARGITEVPYHRLPESFRQMADKVSGGGHFYLPNEIDRIASKFYELSSWSSADWGKLGRMYANVISKLKATLTLPYPGFHTKNMLGDVFMGLLDDINPGAYQRIAKQWALNKAGKATKIDIIPGHIDFNFKQMLMDFRDHADAGFFNVEFGTYNSLTAGAIPRRMGRKLTNTVRNISDDREVIPRFVHYVEAYKQEAQALWKKGVRDIDAIKKQAADAALWRTNHYKFDYSALMPWEKTIRTLAFPFYTYLRKAVPVLLEQMYMNPKYFALINRFMQYNDGSGSDVFNHLNVPSWIKDIGFGMLTDEEEPWALTQDILPMNALDIIGSGGPEELAQNVMANLNPIAKAPVELGTGKSLFDDRPLQGDAPDYFWNNLPFASEFQEQVYDVPGIPGGEQSTEQLIGGESPLLGMDRINNRLTGLGLPFREITFGQQEQQLQANKDRLIDEPLQQFNYSQDLYRISTAVNEVGQTVYRVRQNSLSGEEAILAEFATPNEAIAFASQLPGADFQAPNTNSLRPPTAEDLMSQIAGMQ